MSEIEKVIPLVAIKFSGPEFASGDVNPLFASDFMRSSVLFGELISNLYLRKETKCISRVQSTRFGSWEVCLHYLGIANDLLCSIGNSATVTAVANISGAVTPITAAILVALTVIKNRDITDLKNLLAKKGGFSEFTMTPKDTFDRIDTAIQEKTLMRAVESLLIFNLARQGVERIEIAIGNHCVTFETNDLPALQNSINYLNFHSSQIQKTKKNTAREQNSENYGSQYFENKVLRFDSIRDQYNTLYFLDGFTKKMQVKLTPESADAISKKLRGKLFIGALYECVLLTRERLNVEFQNDYFLKDIEIRGTIPDGQKNIDLGMTLRDITSRMTGDRLHHTKPNKTLNTDEKKRRLLALLEEGAIDESTYKKKIQEI